MKNSSELSELDELEQRANEARRLADEKNRALESMWNEWNSIEPKADDIKLELAGITEGIESLKPEALEQSFKESFAALLRGARGAELTMNAIASVVVTRQWRIDVLNEKATEVNAQLAELKARSKVLAKKLGQKSPL